jgi:hypothetical protein
MASEAFSLSCLSNDPQSEDRQPHYKGVPVGRIYRSTFAGEEKRRWSIYINDTAQPAEGAQLLGDEPSLTEATAAFERSFEALIAAGTVRIIPDFT